MVKVRVPATSANLGPGFDVMGIAVDLYNVYGFEEIEQGLEFEGVEEEFCNKNNIIYQSMLKAFEKANYECQGVKISILEQNVPISRGLGSSSSCIVAGLVGANVLMGNKLSKEEIFELAVEIEGHPDNVAPAVFGGMIVSIKEGNKYYYDKVNIKENIKFVPIIPNFRLSTKEARKVVPNIIAREDGVYNVGRAALMVTALSNGNLELLKFACKDSFHEKYRGRLIQGFDFVREKAYEMGALASFLSGAGPTIMTLAREDDSEYVDKIKQVLKSAYLEWDVLNLAINNNGAEVIE